MGMKKKILVYLLALAMVFTLLPIGTAGPVMATTNPKIAYITHDNSNQNDGFQRVMENEIGYTMTRFIGSQYSNQWDVTDLASYSAIIIDPSIRKNQIKDYDIFKNFLINTPKTVIVGMADIAVDLGLGTSSSIINYGYNTRTSTSDRDNPLVTGTSYASSGYYFTKSSHSSDIVHLEGVPSYAKIIVNNNNKNKVAMAEYFKDETLANGELAKGNRYLVPFKDKKFGRDFENAMKTVIARIFGALPTSFSILINSDSHGTIVGEQSYNMTAPTIITTSVNVDEGYELLKWEIEEDGTKRSLGNSASISVQVNQDAIITAKVISENQATIEEFKVLEVQPYYKVTNGTYPTHEIYESNFENYFANLGQDVNVSIERVSIEGFNTKVDQLNGKYDLIYFGNKEYYVSNDPRYSFIGTSNNGSGRHITYYSADSTASNAPTKPSKAPGNGMKDSNSIESYSAKDITNKRSKALMEFIESGHLVVFDNEIFSGDYNSTNLYKNFKDVNVGNFKRSNFDQTSMYSDICNDMINGAYTLTDQIEIISAPRQYTGVDSILNDSRWLRFNFSVISSNEDIKDIKLYLDVNGDGLYKESEVVIKEELTSPENMSIDYQLPPNYVGFLPWKLEIENRVTHAKSYVLGSTAYKVADDSDEIQQIRVLQLYPGTGGLLNLQTLNNVNGKNYLNEPGIYNITVDRMGMAAFDNSYDTNNPKLLNGYYDMVIIGFADSVSNGGNMENPKMHAELKKFIESGQSLMLTHDMFHFYSKKAKNGDARYAFGKEFRDMFGQNVYAYDPVKYADKAAAVSAKEFYPTRIANDNSQFKIGFSDGILTRANNNNMYTTGQTFKMNDGLVTMFPFNPTGNNSDIMSVATTHTQYYQLDLENEDLVTWYTLYGNKNDQMDGQNSYYIYSVNNITYSGTGHAGGFTQAEKQLFTNTMLKAYASANHAPIAEVNNLENGKEYYKSDDSITFSVKGVERDILDEYLKLEVFVSKNSNDDFELVKTITIDSKEFEANKLKDITLAKDADFNQSVDTFAIKVKVSDEGGAYTEKVFTDLTNSNDIALGLDADWSNGNRVLIGDSNVLNIDVKPLESEETGNFSDMKLTVKTPISNKGKYSDGSYETNGWSKTEDSKYIYYKKNLGMFIYNDSLNDYQALNYDQGNKISESLGFTFNSSVSDDIGFDISLDYNKVINEHSRKGNEHITGKYVEIEQGIVNVTVKDKRGRPIPNVPVNIKYGTEGAITTVNTANDGSVSFDSLTDGSGNYTINVKRPAGDYTLVEVAGTDISDKDEVSYTMNLDASNAIRKAEVKVIYETISDKAFEGQMDVVTVDNKVVETTTKNYQVKFKLHKDAEQIQFTIDTNIHDDLANVFADAPTCNGASVSTSNNGLTYTLTNDGVLPGNTSYVVNIPVTVEKDTMFSKALYAMSIDKLYVEEIILDNPEDQALLPESFGKQANVTSTDVSPVDPNNPDPTDEDKFYVNFDAGATGVIEEKGVGIIDLTIRPAKDADLNDVVVEFEADQTGLTNPVSMRFVRVDDNATTLDGVSLVSGKNAILLPRVVHRGETDTTYNVRIEVEVTDATFGEDFNVKFKSILGVDISAETSIPTRSVKVLEPLKLD